MNLADARTIKKGDTLIHPETAVRWRPISVTDVWMNKNETIVLVRLASVDKTAWLDATGYEFPKPHSVWCKSHSEWESREVNAERHPNDIAARRTTASKR